MKQVGHTTRSGWSVQKDDVKFGYLDSIIRSRHRDALNSAGLLSDFYHFLLSEDCYKYSAHLLRYVETFANMITQAIDFSGRIVEMGGSSPILEFIAYRFPSSKCYHTESDLRLEIDCPSEFADIVLSLEVIEHIKDMPEKSFDELVLFRETGIKRFVDEIQRITRSGATVFLTTPNATSSLVLERLLLEEPPMVYRPHVREFTRDELADYFQDFSIVAHTTMYNFFLLNGESDTMRKLYAVSGASMRNRGDDHFFRFVKP